ncbi:MAG: hypothetical protein GY811_12665 [Myxococcales bacterium]|nr:hypothetical protein [Myxococcales bacterium]
MGCAPRVHRSNKPFVFEEDTKSIAGPPIETVEIPRIRTGSIARAKFDETLDAGVGAFLGGLDIAAHVQGGNFAGWQIESFDNPWVDLVPGDIVKSVNGARIETPAQVQALWLRLKGTEQILVSVMRGEAAFELRFTVQGTVSPEGT